LPAKEPNFEALLIGGPAPPTGPPKAAKKKRAHMVRLIRKSLDSPNKLQHAGDLSPRLARYLADIGCFAAADAFDDRWDRGTQHSKPADS
jgi:hypothetical protein